MNPKNKEKSKDKSKAGPGWSGKKIAFVVVGVLFVVLMVVSSLGMSWLSSLKSTQTGDVATIGYTIWDDQNRPIVTTNSKLYNDTITKGDVIFYSNVLQVPVNVTTQTNVTKIPVLYKGYDTLTFGLFRDELNQISQGLSGMKVGEQKKISLVMPYDNLESEMSTEQFSTLVKNATEARLNEQIVLALVDNPQIRLDNTTAADQYMRTFYVKNISPDGINMKYGYQSVDIQVLNLKA